VETRDEVRAFCRHHFIPLERAETVDLPLWLTKARRPRACENIGREHITSRPNARGLGATDRGYLRVAATLDGSRSAE
jgi:hypothetical protein